MRLTGIAVLLLLVAAPALATPPDLDDGRWLQLQSVSAAAFALPDVGDLERWHRTDYWEVADAAGGDCEDKALFARAALLAQGWPATSLRLALGWTETGEYHAVLTIDVTRHGRPATYVIDGRFGWVVGWDALTRHGYRWDRRQAAAGPGWLRIAAQP